MGKEDQTMPLSREHSKAVATQRSGEEVVG
jgi:hypothetical protein